MARTQILVHKWGPEQGFRRFFVDRLNQSLVSSMARARLPNEMSALQCFSHVVQIRHAEEQETRWDKTNKELTFFQMLIIIINRLLMYLLFPQRFPKATEIVGGYKIAVGVSSCHYSRSL